jgi:RNA polymerase sigma factor (sigma-70 family)
MDKLTDTEALRRSLAEPTCFAVVYDRHLRAIHDYVRRRVGDEQAHDLTAEVFVRAFHARSRYDVRYATALPWLLGFATNLISEHRREERRRLALIERIAARSEHATADRPQEQLAPELARALRKLRPGDRDALLLVVWGELSYDEAAHALNLPIGTVRSRIARARRRLTGDLQHPSVPPAISANGEEHA